MTSVVELPALAPFAGGHAAFVVALLRNVDEVLALLAQRDSEHAGRFAALRLVTNRCLLLSFALWDGGEALKVRLMIAPDLDGVHRMVSLLSGYAFGLVTGTYVPHVVMRSQRLILVFTSL